ALVAGCAQHQGGSEEAAASDAHASSEAEGQPVGTDDSLSGATRDQGSGSLSNQSDSRSSVAVACEQLQLIVTAEEPSWPSWVSSEARKQLETWTTEQRGEFAVGLDNDLRLIRPNVRILSLEDYPLYYAETANSERQNYYCFWGIGEDVHLVEVGIHDAPSSRGSPVWVEPPLPRSANEK